MDLKVIICFYFFGFLIGQDCDEDEVELWSDCYSIDSTTHIDFTAQNIYGEIPPTIGDLVNLVYLDLAANNLSGSIPDEIGNLLNLNYLYLQNNELSGSIPTTIGDLTKSNWIKIIW